MKNNLTLVTGLWDIKRGELTEGWSRSYDHYLEKFSQLLDVDCNMIIYGDDELEKFVFTKRNESNTQFIKRELDWFVNNSYYDLIQNIRIKPEWFNQASWLEESTQAKLDLYNPLVMSKMFLLNDARIMSKFDTEYIYWIDAGLTNTVHVGYFTHDNVLDTLTEYCKKFSFICFPYEASNEIHGFSYEKMNSLAESKVNKVARGGFFGGPKDLLSEINNIYYGLLVSTLTDGYMGTEESLFTLMVYNHPEIIQYFEIESNGLISTFFENLKNKTLSPKIETSNIKRINTNNINNTALYVLTFNFPNQFETLCKSFELYDNTFLTKPKKFLLNNSTDRSTDERYSELCLKYGFEEIKKDNIGICGGRQFIAEHAEENGFDYHFFFEDDMFFYVGEDEFCRNGFMRKIKNFYDKMMNIIWKEEFDILKWNFTEFFGDSSRQWAWHNVPQVVREEHFPERPFKTENDNGKEPYLKFKNIKSCDGLPYATGEIYYSNWPQVVSKQGNRKMFLDTTWAAPYEQTWMSYIFQETVKGNINPAVLLATPTEHNRFEYYKKEERREN
jgi:hypothetical protein